MEIRAGVAQADRFSAQQHIRQDKDVGVVGVVKSVNHMRLRPAPIARKGPELFASQLLVRENHEAVVMERCFNLRELCRGQGLRQIQLRDTRTGDV